MKRSLFVTALGYVFFGVNYLLQILIFRKLDETAISEYSVFMAMLMFVPFLLGLEKHIQRSRNIANDAVEPIKFGLENILVLAIVTVVFVQKQISISQVAVIVSICISELLILEGTRVLIARGDSIKGVVIGGIRAMLPLVAFSFIPAINLLFLLIWLILTVLLFVCALITTTFRLSDFQLNIVDKMDIPWVYFISGSVKAAFPWITRTALIYFLGRREMANVVIAMSIFSLIEIFAQNFWLTAQYKTLMTGVEYERERYKLIIVTIGIYIMGISMFLAFKDLVNIVYNKSLYLFPIGIAGIISLIKVLSSVYSVFQIKMNRHYSVLTINLFIYAIVFSLLYSFWLGIICLLAFIILNHVKVNHLNLS